jgi:hypothetical protein
MYNINYSTAELICTKMENARMLRALSIDHLAASGSRLLATFSYL